MSFRFFISRLLSLTKNSSKDMNHAQPFGYEQMKAREVATFCIIISFSSFGKNSYKECKVDQFRSILFLPPL